MKEKIEEIYEHFGRCKCHCHQPQYPEDSRDDRWEETPCNACIWEHWEAVMKREKTLKQNLSTLIQAERKKDREMIYKDIQANYHITADEFYKHYLQSLDKGDRE